MSNPLSSIRIFRGVELAELDALWLAAQRTEFEKSAVVFQQGDVGDHALFLLKGRFTVEVEGTEGRRKVGDVWPGELVGERALSSRGDTRSATIRAGAPCLCMVVTRELLVQTRGNGAVMALERHMLETMAKRIRSTNLAIEQVWREQRSAQAQAAAQAKAAAEADAAAHRAAWAEADASIRRQTRRPQKKPPTLRERLAALFGGN